MRRLALLIMLVGVSEASAAAPLLAGTASVDITPPTGYPMWGYAARKDAPCVGVLDPLKARVVVLGVGVEKLAIVSLDLGRAPPRASLEALRGRARRAAGVTHLLLCASHTHHGPVLELDDWPTPKTSYLRALEDKLATAIAEAARDLRPVRLGVAVQEVPLNRNRHSKRPDRPVDRELRVLRLEDQAGRPVAHLVHFAAHATLTDNKIMKFSADWPGAMASLVEKETGAPCLFLQGAAGDLSANTSIEASGSAGFGKAMAQAVLTLARTVHCEPLPQTTLAIHEDDFTFTPRIDLGNPGIFAVISSVFFPKLVAFYEREYRDGVRPHLTTALLDGRFAFVGVSGEFFCGHSLSLKRRARLEQLFFVGYCNDYQQYFPTIEAAAEGGYGTEPTVAPAEIGAGERVVDRALLRLYQLRGKLNEPTSK